MRKCAKHLNIEELTSNIARQFPDMEFTLDIWADNDPIGCSYLWNGNQWIVNEEPEELEYIDEQSDHVADVAPGTYTPDEDEESGLSNLTTKTNTPELLRGVA